MAGAIVPSPDIRAFRSRSGVIAVQLDDIDCKTSEITIRDKRQRYDRLPFKAEVGEALVEYFCHKLVSGRRPAR